MNKKLYVSKILLTTSFFACCMEDQRVPDLAPPSPTAKKSTTPPFYMLKNFLHAKRDLEDLLKEEFDLKTRVRGDNDDPEGVMEQLEKANNENKTAAIEIFRCYTTPPHAIVLPDTLKRILEKHDKSLKEHESHLPASTQLSTRAITPTFLDELVNVPPQKNCGMQ